MSSVPKLFPSSLNWTPTTPTLSVAVDVTVIVPVNVAPLEGDIIETFGGVVSAFETVMLIDADVFVFPAASLANAVKVCSPLEVIFVSHEIE